MSTDAPWLVVSINAMLDGYDIIISAMTNVATEPRNSDYYGRLRWGGIHTYSYGHLLGTRDGEAVTVVADPGKPLMMKPEVFAHIQATHRGHE